MVKMRSASTSYSGQGLRCTRRVLSVWVAEGGGGLFLADSFDSFFRFVLKIETVRTRAAAVYMCRSRVQTAEYNSVTKLHYVGYTEVWGWTYMAHKRSIAGTSIHTFFLSGYPSTPPCCAVCST